MNSVFLLHILIILLHFLIEFISGGGGHIYNQKVKYVSKNIGYTIFNTK